RNRKSRAAWRFRTWEGHNCPGGMPFGKRSIDLRPRDAELAAHEGFAVEQLDRFLRLGGVDEIDPQRAGGSVASSTGLLAADDGADAGEEIGHVRLAGLGVEG